MNLLRADLERYEFRPVWFNAWHHQKEQHLFAALLEAVRSQAVPPWLSYAGLVFRWRLLRRRTRAHRFWTVVLVGLFGISLGAIVVNWPEITATLRDPFAALQAAVLGGQQDAAERVEALFTGFREGLAAASPLFGLLASLIGLWAAARNRLAGWQFSPAKLMASLGDRMEVRALDAQLNFRHEFAGAFREVCEALHPRTLVIVIDDLDRCRPEQVVETLEAVNFLVTAGPCYVILGIAPEQVMRCVGLGFKDIAAEMAAADVQPQDDARVWRREFARNYLEKLINVQVPVPTLTGDDARKIVAAAGERAERNGPANGGGSGWWLPLFLVGLFLGALYLGANADRWLQPPAATDVAGGVTTTVEPAPGVPGGTAVPAGGVNNPPEPRQPESAYFREGKDAEAPWWSWQVPLPALGVLGALVLLVQALRREDPVVRDSPEFVKALDIWVPVVLTRTRSPRAVKRFVNRVRYYAMNEVSPEPSPTWKERLRALLGRPWVLLGRDRPPPPQADAPTRLPESLLVALAAIQQWRPESISAPDGADFEALAGLQPGSTDDIVLAAWNDHMEAFGRPEPGEPAIRRFRELAAGVTVR